MPSNAELTDRDLAHVWHPCSQMKDYETLPMIPVSHGKGVWLTDFDGKRYLDAVSSWWVNLFGHANPTITAAVQAQAAKLEQVILSGFTHEPVIDLSERLAAITPGELNRCFYADNGSSAVEVALKMSFHYWKNRGQTKKKRFVNLSNSYHGETLGALAVGDVGLYKDVYAPLLLTPITVASPDCYLRDADDDWATHSRKQFAHMERVLAEQGDEIAAVIVEPLVQCAGNMRMYHPDYLRLLRKACDEYNVHLIADEIAVGFGRTGSLFACEQADIAPDFMCLSKGLTGGYLPLSVTVTHEEIYQAFYDDYANIERAFLHSHSYTGNPLACQAALATLSLFDDGQVIQSNQQKAQFMRAAVAELEDHPHVGEIRQTGMILAIEMVQERGNKTPYPWQQRRGIEVYKYALTQGVLLRPLGNVLYFMPPYVINEEEMRLMANTAIEGVARATRN